MKKSLTIVAILLLVLVVAVSAVSATSGVIQWTVGDIEGISTNPPETRPEIVGADEFPAANQYYPVREVNIDTGGAGMVGYIGDLNVCNYVPLNTRPCTDTAGVINLNFTLQCNVGEATFRYGRYGSETDLVLLDGAQFDVIVGTGEQNFREDIYELGPLSAGPHTITIDYAGGGANNGHYIDYVQLETQYECLVDIDIKPGSYPSSVNLGGGGSVPVAILGSAFFDVTEIRIDSTLMFEGATIRTRGNGDGQCGVEDVNFDGFNDLVCQFIRSEINLDGSETTATVTGYLKDGTFFQGTGDINIITD